MHYTKALSWGVEVVEADIKVCALVGMHLRTHLIPISEGKGPYRPAAILFMGKDV